MSMVLHYSHYEGGSQYICRCKLKKRRRHSYFSHRRSRYGKRKIHFTMIFLTENLDRQGNIFISTTE
ncbi:hypothetical protein K1719_045642 [Acacia pycnantha]|nr:hypothetical protein K1719_045642 [Acacia pycnantha]